MTPDELGAYVTARIPGASSIVSYDEVTVDVVVGDWLTAATLVATDPALACDFFDWLSALDEANGPVVVVHLYSPSLRHHVRLRTRPSGEPVPTLTGLFRGADWHERETHEMFGVAFTGEGHRVPLLLPDGFEGNPLRKDFVLMSRAVKVWPGLVEPAAP